MPTRSSWLGGVVRFARNETILVVLAASALAVLMTWPTLLHPASTVPQDIGDPLGQAWYLSWPGHILASHPGQLWNANTFFPDADTYAYSDTLLGYAPASFLGSGPEAALVRYNVMFVFAQMLAFAGGYALVRQLGSNWTGAALAGTVFAFAPWRLAQAGHLNILSTGGIALALAALARGHGFSLRDGFQYLRIRPKWAAIGWAVATWQITLGFATGLPFFYVLALIFFAAVIGWIVAGHPRPPWRLIVADGAGLVGFLAVTYFMVAPLLRIRETQPDASRSTEEIGYYSAPFLGFFTSPPESRVWGHAHEAWRASLASIGPYKGIVEITLLPGFVVLALAFAGLFISSWRLWLRLTILVVTLATGALAMGTELAGGRYTYLVLYHYFPGWNALRTPGRLMIWISLLLAVLAAGFITRLADLARTRMRRSKDTSSPATTRPRWWPRIVAALLVVPALLALGEGLNTTAHPTAPLSPAALRQTNGPVLILPSDSWYDTRVMLWSTEGYPRIVNGSSAVRPINQQHLRQAAQSFPDPSSVDILRSYGIRTVIIIRADVRNTPFVGALMPPAPGLPLTRTETPEAVVFTLDPWTA